MKVKIGREAPYRKKFSRIADEIIVVDKFSEMANAKKNDFN